MTPLWDTYRLPVNTGTPPMAMDYRHVVALHDAIIAAHPTVAVEIGSYMGHSTTAFLHAMESLLRMELHLFEPCPTPELLRIISGNPRVHLHESPIWDSPLKPDFVFIDGDHGVPALADLAFCLARDVKTIAMHDSNGFTAGLTPSGSETAANLLASMPTRAFTEDKESRDGEWTQRGFLVSHRI